MASVILSRNLVRLGAHPLRQMKILDLVYRFFRPLPLKRFAIGLVITHFFKGNGQKNRVAQKTVSSLPMGIEALFVQTDE